MLHFAAIQILLLISDELFLCLTFPKCNLVDPHQPFHPIPPEPPLDPLTPTTPWQGFIYSFSTVLWAGPASLVAFHQMHKKTSIGELVFHVAIKIMFH